MVTPAVINSGPAVLLIANPSPRPEVLYKGQQISSAVRLYEQFGSLEMPASSLCSTPLVGAVNNMAVRHLTKTCLDPEWIDLSHAGVSPEERTQLAQLFYEFRDRISTSTYDLGSYEESEIVIKTTTDVPPHRYRPPRVPLKFQKKLDEHINRLLRAGRIVESDTPWVHNTVLVKKKDGSLRVCLDFRPLNEVTIPDHYPLPRIDDILSKISGHKYYTTLDLASGYMQLLLSPESQEKCGWITHRGIYQFVYLPFGLKNAGAYFCRAMSRILAGLEDNCLAYLDDIVVFDKDFPSHLASLRKVFHRFRLHNIKASGKKLTEIARSKINFLGHELSGHRYSPADRNIRAIRDFPTPTTNKEVKSFVGMANFFRKFIANFALIASPLYALLKDKAQFTWGIEQEKAFQRLKQLLTSTPCLAFPQDKEFFLHTDGSQLAVGAALFQTCFEPPTQLAAVGYFSKALSDSQRKWSPTHIELFAIISALRFFRPVIYGNHTTVFSDHRPLTYLLKHNKTHDNLARWVIELQSYNVTIEYLKGSSNVVADALSRVVDKKVRFEDNTPDTDDIVEFPVSINVLRQVSYSVRPSVLCLGQFRAIRPYDALLEQKQDDFCSSIATFIETQRFPASVPDEQRPFLLSIAEHCVIQKNGCLYYRDPRPYQSGVRRERLVVPEKLKEPVFLALHSSPSAGGHFNWRKTLAKISRKYFWPHMAEDIFALVRSCEQCQRKRNQQTNRELLAPVTSGAIFDKVYVDLTGPLHTSENGNKYILAMIDHFSKYVIATPLPDCTAITVAHAIMSDCILVYGVMTQLASDNASYFKGEVLSEVGRLLRISRYFTTPYHHEGNGACERVFATFHPMLRTYIAENQLDWDRYVKACAFMYNTSVHTSTNNTPYFLMFGRDPVFNIDLLIRHDSERHTPSLDDAGLYVENLVATLHAAWRSAKDFNDRQRAKYKQQHDRTHLRPLDIRVGDRVFLRDLAPKVGLSSKLCNPWLGQFRVVEVDPPHLTIVSVSAPQSSPRRVHMNQVKRCYELSGPVFTSQWTPVEEQAALSAAGATELTMPGYTHQASTEQLVTEPSGPTHHYNTRFRSRRTSL
uniref:RNA-directed DNA polymerase n=1 Tax=Haemonchus contortus TaxID=6289 RepID=A0A7I4Z3Z2_HAECO